MLFPSSLDKMANVFNENGKLDFDHSNVTLENYFNKEFLDKLKNYCSNDSLILAKSFYKYRAMISNNFQVDITSPITLASLAFKIFRSKYYTKEIIQQSHGCMYSFIKNSYRGGVSDIYRPRLENGYYYDVNSLYPYVMANNYMPVGVGQYVNVKLDTNFNIHDFFGFISVKVKCPKSLYIPFLTVNHPQYGLISPVGEWVDTYFSEEIKYALTLGYEFEYFSYYKFEKEIIFNDYVNDIYSQRVLNKDKKDLSHVLKLLLNSLYGRFGMSISTYKNLLLKTSESDDDNYLNRLALVYDIDKVATFKYKFNEINLVRFNEVPDIDHIRNLYNLGQIDDTLFNCLLKESTEKTRNLNIAVHIASSITAYARIYMHKLKNRYKDHLYYSDTDSLIIDVPLAPELISSDQLGLLKLECKVSKGLFIAPKLYYIESENGEIIKSKGITSSVMNSELFQQLYNNIPIKVNITRSFIRNFTNYTIGSKTRVFELSGTFKKREKIYAKDYWVDTMPFVLKTK